MSEKIKVVIFGTGMFYKKRKHMLPQNAVIVAFIDNNVEKEGKYMDGVMIYSPEKIVNLEYDIVILASASFSEMKGQLLNIGVLERKIIYWEKFICQQSKGIIEKYDVMSEGNYKKWLILVPVINMAGGYLTAVYVGLCLKKLGYSVTIASSLADKEAIKETNCRDISVWICPSLLYLESDELEWVMEFDCVWANSLQCMQCVDRISNVKPTVWWLHEYSGQYENCISVYGEDIKDLTFSKAKVYAVSMVAKKNLTNFFNVQNVGILEFGIPDFCRKLKMSKNKVIIAMIGTVSKTKNQKELLWAIERLPEELKENVECWLIGRKGEDTYYEEIDVIVKKMTNVRLLGEMNREKIESIFSEIDIVVCSSNEETMCAAVVEGMMNHKLCITTSNTGIADFIRNKENGYIYQVGNKEELYRLLVYVISNIKKLDRVRNAARSTYEKYFTMEVLGERLNDVIKEVD